MKIRTDFVTNSSSSSFILAFKSEEDIERVRDRLPDYWKDEIIDEVIENIRKGIVSKSEAIAECKENVSTYDAIFQGKRTWDYPYDEWSDPTSDVGQFLEAYREDKIAELKKELENYSIFSCIEYSDNSGQLDSELEHDIIPYLSNTIATFSHH